MESGWDRHARHPAGQPSLFSWAGQLRPYVRTYANGEVHHLLRERGFLNKVPPSWRELHASGRELQSGGVPREQVAQRLGVNLLRW